MLWRKMWRNLWENKAAYLACIAVIAIGLMVYTSISIVFDSLITARENFYRDYRFANGFIRVRGMPQSQVDRLREAEGVDEVDGRLVKDVRVLSEDREENVFLRLVSIRPGQQGRLNDIRINEGVMPSARERGILLDTDFFAANHLAPGDRVPVIIAGNRVELRVTGTAQSPEFVYTLRTVMDIYPNPEVFGVAYLPLEVMKNLFNEQNLNDIVFTLQAGADYEEVESRLKPRLEPYGLETIFARENQVSDLILEQELTGMQSMVTAMPVLFLSVAAIIMYILLKRMVEQQRGQIGTLKAFGYTNREILLHYISYALVIGAVGGTLGGLLGIWLSFPFMRMYEMFFNLPGLTGQFSLEYLLLGILLSLGFSCLAGYFGGRDALKLQPAEAMRPPAPPLARRTVLERWRLFWESLNVQGKMATRNLFRNLKRSFFTLLGVMFSFSLVATTGYFAAITDVLIVEQFTRVQAHDVKVVFNSPVNGREAVRELARLPGVNRAEPYLEAPVILKNRALEKGTVLLGLAADTELYNILSDRGLKVDLPAEGILLSERLAGLLSAEVGTRLEAESAFARESPFTVEVAGIVPQYLGLNAYAEIRTLTRLLNQGEIVTSVLLAADEEVTPYLRDRYGESARVFAVEEKGAQLVKFNELMESFGYMTYILAAFGVLTGFAVIYNSSIVSLSERKRELASLRVLGMTPEEVLQVLTFEQWFISFFGMLAGIPMTMALVRGMADATNSDVFTLPTKFQIQPMIVGALVTAAAIWITHLAVAGKIKKLSMVEVLKEND